MERGRRKRTMERDVEKEDYNGTGWRGVEGSVQWNGMDRGRRKSTRERDEKG